MDLRSERHAVQGVDGDIWRTEGQTWLRGRFKMTPARLIDALLLNAIVKLTILSSEKILGR